jgi:hypothetical protein
LFWEKTSTLKEIREAFLVDHNNPRNVLLFALGEQNVTRAKDIIR